MSSSRSVAAAQRRRAAPTQDAQPSRGPATSINSSQAFTQNQQPMRPGTTGRLAAQQAVLNQKQQQQAQQFDTASLNDRIVSPLKMTVAQVIQIITLRLGKLEQQIQNLELSNLSEGFVSNASSGVDNNAVNDILRRIENLEQGMSEINVCKQQLDALKPAVVSVKNLATGSSNEVNSLKKIVEEIKSEISATKITVSDLQSYVNSSESNVHDQISLKIEETLNSSTNSNVSAVVNLKDIIEQELNANA